MSVDTRRPDEGGTEEGMLAVAGVAAMAGVEAVAKTVRNIAKIEPVRSAVLFDAIKQTCDCCQLVPCVPEVPGAGPWRHRAQYT